MMNGMIQFKMTQLDIVIRYLTALENINIDTVHGIDIKNHDIENGILPTNSIFYDVNEHESYSTNENNDTEIRINTTPRETQPNEPDYKKYIPHFAW